MMSLSARRESSVMVIAEVLPIDVRKPRLSPSAPIARVRNAGSEPMMSRRSAAEIAVEVRESF